MGLLEVENGKIKAVLTNAGKKACIVGGLINKIKNGYFTLTDKSVFYGADKKPTKFADINGDSDTTNAKGENNNKLY